MKNISQTFDDNRVRFWVYVLEKGGMKIFSQEVLKTLVQFSNTFHCEKVFSCSLLRILNCHLFAVALMKSEL